MTAASSVAYPSMDLLHPEDTMDLASSPRMPADDLDLPYELETMRDASLEPIQEPMIEDPINTDHHSTEDVQLVDEDLLDDEDMVDEDTVVRNTDTNHEDFSMESHHQTLPTAQHEEDDILYDDEELVREANNQAQDTQDVEITDEEDLFREDQKVQEHSLEDAPRTQQFLDSNHDEEILNEEQTTNMNNQDVEGLGAIQGRLVPGDFANNISDQNVEDQTNLEGDTNHRPDQGKPPDTADAGEIMTSEPATAPNGTAGNPQTSDFLELAKIGQAGSSAADVTEGSSQVKASEVQPHESERARPANGERPMHGAEADEHFADRQVHTILHTIKVNYQDTEICLFPPNEDDESETFFLADVDLAYQSLDRLLGACHDVLAGTIGHDDELVLDIPSLGLHISQDSSHASQMTLSQILDVYLALSHNHETESVDPLYCHLSSRISLASQYAYLLSSSEQGKTFAEIAAENIHSHESSPVDGEEGNDFIESYGETHEDLGPEETAGNGDLMPKDTNLEDTILGAAEVKLGYHAPERRTKEDLNHHEDQSDLNPLDNKLENNDPDTTGNAENETSATSTVRGDELESQDFETSYDDAAESANAVSIPENRSEDIAELATFHDDLADDEERKADIHSAVGDTESSRTIEAGDDAFHQPVNAEAEAKRENLVENSKDSRDYVDARVPADNPDVQDQFNADSVQAGGLYRYNQAFPPAPQSVEDAERVATTPSATSELDHDDLLDFHGEYEGHTSSEQAAFLDLNNGTAGNEAFAQADRHEELYRARTSSGPTQEAETEAEHNVIYDAVDEDDLFLDDDKTEASVYETTPPSTPSNSKTSKRKTREEEDDFHLLDSGTPDFKRRRPS